MLTELRGGGYETQTPRTRIEENLALLNLHVSAMAEKVLQVILNTGTEYLRSLTTRIMRMPKKCLRQDT
jgi:hypothetical protein